MTLAVKSFLSVHNVLGVIVCLYHLSRVFFIVSCIECTYHSVMVVVLEQLFVCGHVSLGTTVERLWPDHFGS